MSTKAIEALRLARKFMSAGGAVAEEYRQVDEALADLESEQEAPQQPAEGVTADPMEMRLPCDVKVGHGTHAKGTKLRSLVSRMQWMYDELNRLYAEQLAAPPAASKSEGEES